MKELLLKRERIFHFFALGLIAVSLFLKDPFEKMSLLMVGILGLLFLSVLKKQKMLILIYSILLLAAVGFFFYLTKGKIEVPKFLN